MYSFLATLGSQLYIRGGEWCFQKYGSQNFCEISQVSQSRFLRGCQRIRVSIFCKVVIVTIDLSLAF